MRVVVPLALFLAALCVAPLGGTTATAQRAVEGRSADADKSEEERIKTVVAGLLEKAQRFAQSGDERTSVALYAAALTIDPRNLEARIGVLRSANALEAPGGVGDEPPPPPPDAPVEDLPRVIEIRLDSLTRSIEAIQRRLEVLDRRVVDDDGRAETRIERLDRDVESLRRDLRSLEREVDRLRSRLSR